MRLPGSCPLIAECFFVACSVFFICSAVHHRTRQKTAAIYSITMASTVLYSITTQKVANSYLITIIVFDRWCDKDSCVV